MHGRLTSSVPQTAALSPSTGAHITATEITRDPKNTQPKKHATHEMRRGSRCELSAHPSRLREPSLVSNHPFCNHRGAELRSRGVRTDDLANEIL